MVVVDILTKYAHFCELSHQFKASTVATAFMETIKKLHGNPNIIAQRVKCLSMAEWWYNTSFHTVEKMTPFMEIYGYHPPSIPLSLRENSKVPEMEDDIEHQQQFLQILKDNLSLAQNRMKQQADQHRNARSFDLGDWVFLWLQPYKKMSLKKAKKDNKLSPKYYGPYKVLQNIDTMAYKLGLPTYSHVCLFFHVSCLKKFIGEKLLVQTIFPKLGEEGKIILEPEAVMEKGTQ
eukprot:PITA_11365